MLSRASRQDRSLMTARPRPPRYPGAPASERATKAARASSRKRDTRCEVLLRRAVWRIPLRYRIAVAEVPGRPDLVFMRERVAVFCDGDFWHGRNLDDRLHKLAEGHNATYWTAKITANAARDVDRTRQLEQAGWVVLRFWETDIVRDPVALAREIAKIVEKRRSRIRS